MKTNDLLLLGALAVGGYVLYKQIKPSSDAIGAASDAFNTASQAVNTALSSGSSMLSSATGSAVGTALGTAINAAQSIPTPQVLTPANVGQFLGKYDAIAQVGKLQSTFTKAVAAAPAIIPTAKAASAGYDFNKGGIQQLGTTLYNPYGVSKGVIRG